MQAFDQPTFQDTIPEFQMRFSGSVYYLKFCNTGNVKSFIFFGMAYQTGIGPVSLPEIVNEDA